MSSSGRDEAELLIDPEQAYARFDAAASNLQIAYARTNPIPFSQNNFEFHFRVCPQWSQKPSLPPVQPDSSSDQSDIRQPEYLHIAVVPPAHDLCFNAFPVLRPSYLLLTSSAAHRQTSPLDLSDITAGRRVLHGLIDERSKQQTEAASQDGNDYLLIYNCGRNSGCSRFHKHMQIMPRPVRSSFFLFPDRPSTSPANVPYAYELFRHEPSPSTASPRESGIPSRIHAKYLAALDRFRTVLNVDKSDGCIAHNVIMTRDWTVVIPRRAGKLDGISTNAMGMMGMVWVGTQSEMDAWMEKGPWRMLGEMGVAK